MQSKRLLGTLTVESPITQIANFCLSRKNTNAQELKQLAGFLTDETEAIKEHGLTSFFLSRLMEDASELFSDSQRLNISRYLRNVAANTMKKRSQLLALCQVLNKYEVRFLVSKGAIWSQQYYSDARQRPFTDIDILVDQHGHAFKNAIRELGYTDIPTAPAPMVNAQYTIFDKSGHLTPIDAHIAFTNATAFRPVLTFERLWENHQKISIDGIDISVLSDADALIHAIIHRTAHNRDEDKLIWLLDMVLISRNWDNEQWQQLRHLSYSQGIGGITDEHIKLLLNLNLLDAVKLSPIKIKIPQRERLSMEFLENMTDYGVLKGLIINLKGLATTRERIAYALQMAFPDANYMREYYGAHSHASLVIAYAKRLTTSLRRRG